MSDSVRVGTCGYRYYDPRESRKSEYESLLHAYSDTFDVGELNRTFYSLPQTSTAERWRREAADDFEFTVKAWQAITHPWSSPTWNDHREDIPESWQGDVGYLAPTDAVDAAWDRLCDRANALDASIILIQTPPSFSPTDEHVANLRRFVDVHADDGFDLAWEPRGEWLEDRERVGELCRELGLIHVVDLFRKSPAGDHEVLYTRLHGRNEERYNYDYEYSDSELDELATRLERAEHDRVYCLFNNYEMHENGQGLLRRL